MKNYALLDSEGYIISIGSGETMPGFCVELQELPPEPPGRFYRYKLSEQRWVSLAEQETNKILSSEVRQKRNELLAGTDWTQVSDSPLNETKKNLWSAYRQQLRDITNQPGFPGSVTWPDLPN